MFYFVLRQTRPKSLLYNKWSSYLQQVRLSTLSFKIQCVLKDSVGISSISLPCFLCLGNFVPVGEIFLSVGKLNWKLTTKHNKYIIFLFPKYEMCLNWPILAILVIILHSIKLLSWNNGFTCIVRCHVLWIMLPKWMKLYKLVCVG